VSAEEVGAQQPISGRCPLHERGQIGKFAEKCGSFTLSPKIELQRSEPSINWKY
jgi:hypothetical protein